VIRAPSFRGKRIGVLGLARTGLASARALAASGASVQCWDDNAAARDRARAAGCDVADLLDGVGRLDGLLLSPGVPLHYPRPLPKLVTAALDRGVPILGDIEIFARARADLPAHRVVGITGTNGKSTTTALIHHVLATSGVPALLAGNIGVPLLEEEPLPAGGVYVIELSSFQIDLTATLACDVAVLTNITPDHLDRHGDMAGYATAKERLFQMQAQAGVAVIAGDDEPSRSIAARAPGRVVPVPAIAGQADWPALQGPHNARNADCAHAALLALGLDDAAIRRGFASFPGLPHRMERVATVEGVLYVNDSKATNPTSTAPALGAFPAIHWIAGGKAKGDDLDACLPWLGHVRAAYLIGAAAPLFDGLLRDHVPTRRCGDLAAAVAAAHAAARPGEVVLLSPACASFDQFRDFEHRGEAFRALVVALQQGAGA